MACGRERFIFSLFVINVCVAMTPPPQKPCGFNVLSLQKDDGQLKHGLHAICVACNYTTHPTLCATTLLAYHGSKTASPTELTVIGLKLARNSVKQGYAMARTLLSSSNKNKNKNKNDDRNDMNQAAIEDCMELMSDSVEQLTNSISRISNLKHSLSNSNSNSNSKIIHAHIQDALVWTGAALTYQSTCSDGLTGDNELIMRSFGGDGGVVYSNSSTSIEAAVDESGQIVSIALDLVAHLERHLCSWQTPDPYLFPACNKPKKTEMEMEMQIDDTSK